MTNPIKYLLSFIPETLPVGLTAHQTWANEIITLAGAPDNESSRYTLATILVNGSPTFKVAQQAKRSKREMVEAMHKAMSNEVASHVLYTIYTERKAKDKADAEAAALAEQLAATPTEAASLAV